MTIHISVHGQGMPLVLFHGWGFDHHVWYQILPYLTSEYQLFLVDLPGFGLTSFMEWSDFKAALFQRVPPRFALAGWSMGGLYATRLAIEEPEHVVSLLNIASSPCFIQKENWPGGDSIIYKNFYDNLANNPKKTVEQFIESQLQGQKINLTAASLKGLNAGLDVLVNWDLREKLTQLTLPVCYMFGRLDAIIPCSTKLCMQNIYPNFNYVLFPRAAHVVFLTHPELFVHALNEFLR
jgi:pimeloyl-[acyl-carrier protein] methyl ester esterase